jgi:hypothetical protein
MVSVCFAAAALDQTLLPLMQYTSHTVLAQDTQITQHLFVDIHADVHQVVYTYRLGSTMQQHQVAALADDVDII